MRCSAPFMRDHRGTVFKLSELSTEKRLGMTPFPCGWCLPCRINKARMWQHRIMLESKSHIENSFVTLTYEDKNVPINDNSDLVLYKPDLQNFMKRLRKKRGGERIRYFAVGEYGTQTNRPHYHLCLFGLGEKDKNAIELAWSLKNEPIGMIHIGNITSESSRYIAGYTIKKLTKVGDPLLFGKPPEFMLSSKRNGGIGIDEVKRIARAIKDNPYLDTDSIIRTFTINGKPMPLGGYLSNVLFSELGWKEEKKEKALVEYQDKLFLENSYNDDNYYCNIINQSTQYRKQLAAKQKLFKQERTI